MVKVGKDSKLELILKWMASEKETETFKKPDAATILHGVKGKGGGGAGTIIFLILETFSIYLGRENTLKCFSSIG